MGANNSQINELRKLEKTESEIRILVKDAKKNVRTGLRDTVVIFIDMVDSTRLKVKYKDKPEKWVSKLYEFSSIVSLYIKECQGTPVKYIGDEVMAEFKKPSRIKDAINFLNRIDDIEREISKATKDETKVKVSIDCGKVYYISYKGHKVEDPQGTPIDRCARIAKYCQPGTILTSAAFVEKCPQRDIWKKLGAVKLKGLGETEIFQYGEATIRLEKEPKEDIQTLKSADRLCNLMDHVNFRAIAPNAVKIFIWDKQCVALNWIINNKYGVTIDICMDKLPFQIKIFGRYNGAGNTSNDESEKFFNNVMCKAKMFLPNPVESYKKNAQGRLVFAQQDLFDEAIHVRHQPITKSLEDIIRRVEEYISSYPIDQNFLIGKWKNTYKETAVESFEIKEDGRYILDGTFRFKIDNFKYGIIHKQIEFDKIELKGLGNRVFHNKLIVVNNGLLSGFEKLGEQPEHSITYTRLS
jgi:class 3 adenylate cyclase